MDKVAYNNCWGGFSLSKEAVILARELSGNNKWGDITLGGEEYSDGSGVASPMYDDSNHIYGDIERHDPILIEVIERLGDKASGSLAKVKLYKLEGNKYWIEDYDGMETVHTPENTEWIEVRNDTNK